MSTIFLSSLISCMALVIPGAFPTAADFYLLSELIILDFPTLGKPTIPTVICYLALDSPSTLA